MLERVESKTRSQKSSHMKATDLIANLQFLLYHLSPAQSLLYHLLPPARPASSVPSSISSPVASSSTFAAACSEHVTGASGKKHFKRETEANQVVKVNWLIIWETLVFKGQWIATHHSQQAPANSTKLPICFAAYACPVCG